MNEAELAIKYGQLWTTDQMTADFEVMGFSMCMCVVKRKADGVIGSLDFQHSPRFYHSFVVDNRP